jgi:hypothetical protein
VQVEMRQAEMLEAGALGGLVGVLDGALVDAAKVVPGEHRPGAPRDARAELHPGRPAPAWAAPGAREDQVLGFAAGGQSPADCVIDLAGKR